MEQAELHGILQKAEIDEAFELALGLQFRTAMVELLSEAGVRDAMQLAQEVANDPARFGFDQANPRSDAH